MSTRLTLTRAYLTLTRVQMMLNRVKKAKIPTTMSGARQLSRLLSSHQLKDREIRMSRTSKSTSSRGSKLSQLGERANVETSAR